MDQQQQAETSTEETQENALQQQEAQTQENQTQEVDYESRLQALEAEKQKLVDEVHKYKNTARELESKSRAEQERILREKGEWQQLAELKDEELKAERERISQIKESLINKEKLNALKDAGRKKGMREEALNDLELFGMDDVQVETTSMGNVNVLGVEGAIERLKLQRPYLFGGNRTNVNGNMPNVNNDGAGVVTKEELIKLQKEAKKSGDYAAYQKAHNQYRQQRK